MYLVSGSSDIKIHSYPHYELVHVYRPQDSTGQIRNISWCKDGSWMVIVPGTGNAQIVRIKENVRLLQSILGISQPSTAVFQRTTKRNLAMSTQTGGIFLYDIKTRGIRKRFSSSGMEVRLLDWNVKDTHLAAGGGNGEITLYSNTTNQKTNILRIPESSSVGVIRFHGMLRSILTGASDEGIVATWDINHGKVIFAKKAHHAPVTDVVFSTKNYNLLTSVSLDRTFQCYDTKESEVVITVITEQPLSSVDMAPDGVTIATASIRGSIYIYDLRNYKIPLKTIQAHAEEIKCVRYQPICADMTESFQLTDDSVDLTVKEMPQPKSEPRLDSFSQLLENVVEFSTDSTDNEQSCDTPTGAGDSFISELGNLIEGKTSDHSDIPLDIVGSIKKLVEIKQNRSNRDVFSSTVSQKSSTPVLGTLSTSSIANQFKTQETVFSHLSPITNICPPPTPGPLFTLEDVEKIVKQEISDLSDHLRRQFLNLQLCMSKQFVFQEERIDSILHSLQSCTDSNLLAQLEQLQQENAFLRNKINEILGKNSQS